jgi:CBS domain-containing protein
MKTVLKPLQQLTAADLMSTEVTAIPQHMSLRGAAHLLAQFEISGAPVVDEQGRCVGVLSATDFVNWTDKGERAVRRDRNETCVAAHSAWQMFDEKDLPVDEVHNYMTPDPVTIIPSTPIDALARKMRDAHIHRLIVVDREGKPIGVVSSTDLMAAMAGTTERATLETAT